MRIQLRRSQYRDVTDFIEFDIDPDVWIGRLLRQIERGNYEPRTPQRFLIAKSKGFSRVMTMPAVPDLVLFRAVVDHLYSKARSQEHKHVYFERTALAAATQSAANAAREEMRLAGAYHLHSEQSFYGWLRYDEYRRQLIFQQTYQFIVFTDITNFFDTTLYSRVTDSLSQLRVPKGMLGLLFFLLERLSLRDSFSEAPRIGLPVDEFECSRKLAHMVLFPHDARMVAHVGEAAYVRFMDDQNIGVATRAEGLRVLGRLNDSLRRLHLTPNSGKTAVLSLSQARRYLHLRTNARLDGAESLPSRTASEKRSLSGVVRKIWQEAKLFEGEGQWEKILKRIYRLSGVANSGLLRRRARRDLLACPTLAPRIAAYMRQTGSAEAYSEFVMKVINDPEQPYDDVNASLVEELVRLEPDTIAAAKIRRFASRLLMATTRFPGSERAAAVAPILILRYGDKRSLPLLKRCFMDDKPERSNRVIKACATVYASFGRQEVAVTRRAASRMHRNDLAELMRLLDRILEMRTVPDRFHQRLNPSFDSIGRGRFIDMRRLLVARLLSLNDSKTVQRWLAAKKRTLMASDVSVYDKKLISNLV